jgi:hypothetical protein
MATARVAKPNAKALTLMEIPILHKRYKCLDEYVRMSVSDSIHPYNELTRNFGTRLVQV